MASTFLEDGCPVCNRKRRGEARREGQDRGMPWAGNDHRTAVAGRTASSDRPAVPRGLHEVLIVLC